MAIRLLEEITERNIEAVICRVPEFYGPGKIQSLTNTLVFDKIKLSGKLKVPLKDNTLRTLIWTPDASRAMALIANTPDACNQTWHLPCDSDRLTYKQLIGLASRIYGKTFTYTIIKEWMFSLGGFFNRQIKEVQEGLPRYEVDNIFSSEKFRKRFPEFTITTYEQGIAGMMNEQKTAKVE